MCKICFNTIQQAPKHLINFEFTRKFQKDSIITGYFTPFIFEKDKALQALIHSLKYNKKFHYGYYLGKTIGTQGKVMFEKWNINSIIPVPLHKLKKLERGYNQSDYIAKGICKVTGIQVNKNYIKRIRFTESQTKMNLEERKENISDAFRITKKESIIRKNILLVDDVVTTGSTISECGRILKQAGSANVYAASSAIAALDNIDQD